MKPSPFDPSVRNVDRIISFLRSAVLALPPGHEAQFSRELLYFPAPPGFMPADWILEGIVGASYEFSHRRDEVTGNTIFRRRVKPFSPSQGLRTYVSPDRRHLVTQRFDGVFVSPGGIEECVSGLPKGEAVATEGRKYNVLLTDCGHPEASK